jgi:hypothetical protein
MRTQRSSQAPFTARTLKGELLLGYLLHDCQLAQLHPSRATQMCNVNSRMCCVNSHMYPISTADLDAFVWDVTVAHGDASTMLGAQRWWPPAAGASTPAATAMTRQRTTCWTPRPCQRWRACTAASSSRWRVSSLYIDTSDWKPLAWLSSRFNTPQPRCTYKQSAECSSVSCRRVQCVRGEAGCIFLRHLPSMGRCARPPGKSRCLELGCAMAAEQPRTRPVQFSCRAT